MHYSILLLLALSLFVNIAYCQDQVEAEDEVEEVTPKPKKKKKANGEEDGEEDDSNLMKEWETHMHDFVPSDLLTYEVPSKGKEILFENIQKVPTLVRGAYFVASDKKALIDFNVVDSQNKTIVKKKASKEGIFYFNATKSGTYQFIINNKKYSESKEVTFALHLGAAADEKLTPEDLDPIELRLKKVEANIKDLVTETKFTSRRHDSHFKSMATTNQRILIFTIFETLAILCAALWQIYYIKRLLDNKFSRLV